MPGIPHPARPPFEAHDDEDIIAMEKEHYQLVVADAAEVNNSDLSGQVAGLYVRANSSAYIYDTGSVAADDGFATIIDAAGTHFTRVVPAGGPGGDPDVPSTTTPVMDATPGTAGASLTYARGDHRHPSDTSRLPLAGGTMSGTLVLAADPTAPMHAVTRQYVDGLTGVDGIKTIAVTGASPVIADTPTDTVTFVGNGDILITTDPSTDTITFNGQGVKKTGDVMSGELLLKMDSPGLYLIKGVGGGKENFLTGAVGALPDGSDMKPRWYVMPGNGTTETGSGNTGSDFTIERCDDAGAALPGFVLFIPRSTGLGEVLGDPTQPNGIATKNYVDTHSSSGGNSFPTIKVAGQGDVVATSPTDILTFEAGPNITIETTPASDKIKITASGTPGATLADGDYGDIIVSGTGTGINIENGIVTNTKLANMAAGTFKGNITGAPAAPSDVSAANVKTALSLNNVDNTSDASKNTAVATLQNKTLDNTNIITLKDANFTLQDDADVTKQARFQLSGIATGTMRTFTLPNVDSTIVTVASFGTNVAAFLASPTSANLAAALTDETGTAGKVVFDTSPTLVTPNLGVPTAIDLSNATALSVKNAAINDKAVTYPKIQDVTNTNRILGRITAAAGVIEELTAANVRTILSISNLFTIFKGGATDVTPNAAGDTLIFAGGGTVSVAGNDATNTITITGTGSALTDGDKGDITVGSSQTTLTIDANAVTYGKIQNVVSNNVVLGRISGAGGVIEELTGTNLRTLMGLATSDSPQFAAINVGHASDTAITRSAAGVIAVAGIPLYPGIPINSQSANYTTVLSDAQKCIHHPSAAAAHTYTIDGSVAYPVGTCITINNDSTNTVTIAMGTDAMMFAETGATATPRILGAGGIATLLKVETGKWKISGVNLT